jgi:hypothetical protein
MVDGEAGKGDKYRPTDLKKYGENYDKIFRKGNTMNTCSICGEQFKHDNDVSFVGAALSVCDGCALPHAELLTEQQKVGVDISITELVFLEWWNEA